MNELSNNRLPTKKPTTGACRQVFAEEKQVRIFFDNLRKSTDDDLEELRQARIQGEKNVAHLFLG